MCIYIRGLEHLEGIVNKDEDSVFHKHNVDSHYGNLQPPDYTITVTGVYRGDAIERQVTEAVIIKHNLGPQLLNRNE